jgi:hypothetical protein
MNPRHLAAWIAALTLAGCAHFEGFGGFGGDTAKLRLVSLSGARTEIHELANAECSRRSGALIAIVGLGVKGGLNQGRSLGMPLQGTVQRPTATEIAIPAGKPFTGQFHVDRVSGPRGTNTFYEACTRSFVLTPRAGESYEVQVEQYRGGCTLNVFHLSRERDGSYVRREAANARELKTRCD